METALVLKEGYYFQILVTFISLKMRVLYIKKPQYAFTQGRIANHKNQDKGCILKTH